MDQIDIGLSPQEEQELLDALAENSKEYNLLKIAEECNEVSAIILKKKNKQGGPCEPPDAELHQEIGDLLFRIVAICASDLNFEMAVAEAIVKKSKQLHRIRANYVGKL